MKTICDGLSKLKWQTLESMKQRRELLDKAIILLEYELTNPPKPINQDRVNAWVSEQMKWSAEYQEGFYQRLLVKEQAGTLTEGENGILNRFKLQRK